LHNITFFKSVWVDDNGEIQIVDGGSDRERNFLGSVRKWTVPYATILLPLTLLSAYLLLSKPRPPKLKPADTAAGESDA
jgi:hypothetical protein